VEGFNADCSAELAIPITVLPSPIVLFSFSEDTLCTSGEGATWVASPAGGIFSGDGVVNNWFVFGAADFGLNTVTYTYTNSFNCTSSVTDSIVIETCITVDENMGDVISMYPNPFVDRIVMSGGNGLCQYEIFDSIGNMVSSGRVSGQSFIDTLGWPAGSYVVRLHQDGNLSTHRMVKISN
jgi:hypothetical protein